MAPRNHIYTSYPRAAKLLLVRWREVDGVPQGKVIERAAKQWPDLPPIHSSTWSAWRECAEYSELLALITGEQTERERMSELFQAAGGADALTDVSTAAGYALAARAMALASDAEDAAEVRKLMSAIADASKIAGERTRSEYAQRIQAIEKEHEQELAALQAELAQARAEIGRLRDLLAANEIDPDGTEKREGEGLSAAALKRMEAKAKLL